MLSFPIRVSAATFSTWTGDSRHARTNAVQDITEVLDWAVANSAEKVYLYKAEGDTLDLWNWGGLREQFHMFPDRAVLVERDHIKALAHGDAAKLERQLEGLFAASRMMREALSDPPSDSVEKPYKSVGERLSEGKLRGRAMGKEVVWEGKTVLPGA